MITKKLILWVFLAFVALAVITGIAAVVLPSGWVDDEVMITILLAGCYSLGGLIVVVLGGLKGIDGRKQGWTLRISTIALFISLGLFIAGIWTNWRWDQYFLKLGAVALSTGLTFVHRLVVRPLSGNLTAFRINKLTALITGALTGTIVSIAFITDGFGVFDEFMFRVLGVVAIITAGSTIAAGALAFFAPKPGEDEQGSIAASIPIKIACPRCKTSINVQSNKDSRCPICRLQVRIEIKEPRCVCGYLLYKLESETCPECGKSIPEREQWGTSEPGITEPNAERSASGDPGQTPSS